MSYNIKQTTLNSIADIIMGQSPMGETCNQKGDGIPLLNGPSEFGSYHPTPIQFTTDSRKLAKKSDLLFCVRGSTGRMNWADRHYSIGRGLAALRHKRGLEYQPYLKALMEILLPDLLRSATGTTFPNVSRDQLSRSKISVHSPDQQLAIANILSAFDEKIELNRQMCKTLEDIASTLFKSWFIDFDPVKAKAAGQEPEGLSPEIAALFPDSFVESPLGKIPKGWKVKRLEQITDISIGRTPPRKESQWFSLNPQDNKWISIRDLGKASTYIEETREYLTNDAIKKFKIPEIPKNTVILSFKLTIGRIASSSR